MNSINYLNDTERRGMNNRSRDTAVCSRTDNCLYLLICHGTMLKGYLYITEISRTTFTQYHLWVQIQEYRHAAVHYDLKS